MKIDIGRIAVAHIRTLRDSQSSEFSRLDMLVFFGIPLAAGAASVASSWGFSADVLVALLTAEFMPLTNLPDSELEIGFWGIRTKNP